jgi:hypothetical protein
MVTCTLKPEPGGLRHESLNFVQRELPPKDARKFPKEASELKTVFGTEMRKLGGLAPIP